MADRIFEPVRGMVKEQIIIAGSFRPNGTGAVDNTQNTGLGFTVARTAVGKFDVTLRDTYNQAVSVDANLALATPADGSEAKVGTVDVKSTKIVKIETFAGGVLADFASDADTRVHFRIFLKNSSVLP